MYLYLENCIYIHTQHLGQGYKLIYTYVPVPANQMDFVISNLIDRSIQPKRLIPLTSLSRTDVLTKWEIRKCFECQVFRRKAFRPITSSDIAV